MPTCDPVIISPIMREILIRQPKTVLDIGVGMGKFGVLVREYTDIWYRRLEREDWQTKIQGIEIFEGYRNSLWDIYDDIKIGDATVLIDQMPNYDLILMTEVLEHMPKEVGKLMLAKCMKKCSTFIFSFTNSPQDTAFGNVNERHVSQWQESDLGFPTTLLVRSGPTFVYRAGK